MNFPEQICDDCISDLETAYKFRKNCESSDAILNSFVITNADTRSTNEVVFSTDSGDIYKFRAPSSLKVKRIKKEMPSSPVEVPDSEPDLEPDPEPDPEPDAEEEFEFVDQSAIEYVDGDENLVDEDDHTVYYVEQLRDDELEYYEAIEKEASEVDDRTVAGPSKASLSDTLLSMPALKQFKSVNRPPNKFVPKPENDITILGSAEIITKENGKKVYRVKRMFKEETKPLKECKLCGNQYKYQHALDSHMRRHNNEKPFECE